MKYQRKEERMSSAKHSFCYKVREKGEMMARTRVLANKI
jgi:hypothetical protein